MTIIKQENTEDFDDDGDCHMDINVVPVKDEVDAMPVKDELDAVPVMDEFERREDSTTAYCPESQSHVVYESRSTQTTTELHDVKEQCTVKTELCDCMQKEFKAQPTAETEHRTSGAQYGMKAHQSPNKQYSAEERLLFEANRAPGNRVRYDPDFQSHASPSPKKTTRAINPKTPSPSKKRGSPKKDVGSQDSLKKKLKFKGQMKNTPWRQHEPAP